MSRPIPAPPQPQRRATPAGSRPPNARRRRTPKRRVPRWALFAGLGVFLFGMCAAVGLGAALVMSAGRIPFGASALGVNLGTTTQAEAVARLEGVAGELVLRDGNRTWTTDAAELGVTLDAEATVARAATIGMGGLFGAGEVMPVVSVDESTMAATLSQVRQQVELPPRNATVRLIDGVVEPVPGAAGRVLDINATVAAAAVNPSRALAKGSLELVMRGVPPQVADAGPLVAEANALLASPLRVEAWDPFTDEAVVWTVPVSQWGGWLRAENDPAAALGIRLALDEAAVAGYLETQANRTLPDYQFIESAEAAATVSAAVADLDTSPRLRVYEGNRAHTVRAGETITSIAYDYGVPYPYIQDANGGVEGVSVGQSLVIPSREAFLERDPVPGKRVVVSISGNWTRIYENGSLKWDWASSTGINSSPTWPGVYQILSHEENAYAGNWNLYMPWFLGVYKPIPGSGFTNGFHGFPTRGGGQILWENSLGTKVTYGCILLSNTNAKLLYDWADDGVIVEILP